MKSHPFKFCYAVRNIPHIEKRDKGGEDSWSASHNLLVVADGVGGWAAHKVDPGLFSKQLTKDIHELYKFNPLRPLKDILIEAVQLNKNIGSSTAVLLKLDPKR